MRLIKNLGIAAGTAALAIACAGCSAGPRHPAEFRSGIEPIAAVAGAARDGGRVTAPRCSTATAPARALRKVRTAMVPLRGNPFAVVVTKDGRWAFVSLDTSV